MQEQYMTAARAMAELGVGKVKMAELIRTGALPHIVNPLDRRAKLIPVEAVEQLKARWTGRVAGPKAKKVA